MDTSRRRFFKHTLGAAAGLVAIPAVAQVCLGATPAQTPGPFVPNDFPFRQPNEGEPYLNVADSNADLTVVDGASGFPQGQILLLRGRVVDQHCNPVANANVYLWQADDHGHYNHMEDPNVNSPNQLDPNFQYRGIAATDAEGRFQFKTIKPKYYPLDPNDPTMMRTAHLHISVMHPNCRTLITQTYFEGDVLEDIETIRELNRKDIILAPNGKIIPELMPLVVNFALPQSQTMPVGDVTLSVQRR